MSIATALASMPAPPCDTCRHSARCAEGLACAAFYLYAQERDIPTDLPRKPLRRWFAVLERDGEQLRQADARLHQLLAARLANHQPDAIETRQKVNGTALVLEALRRSAMPVTMYQIAERAGLTPQAVGKKLKLLRQSGRARAVGKVPRERCSVKGGLPRLWVAV